MHFVPLELFVKPTTFVADMDSPICTTRSGHGYAACRARERGKMAHQAEHEVAE